MEKFTCIMCPVGCELTVTKNKDKIEVTGNGCIRGERYGISEVTNPTRMITALVKTKKGICSVKTTALVPKDKIFAVLKEIEKLQPKSAKYGEILIKNVCGLQNTNVVVTREP